MAIQAQLADGRILEFPDGTDPAVIQATVKRMIGEQPVETAGIGEAAVGGAKRYLSRGLTALESLIGDTGEAARAGVARQQAITERPGASLEAVKQAYERGILPAAGEVLSQAPAALAEQGFNIGATLTGARLGAMAGTAVAPGIGTAIGAIGGALVPNLLQLFAENIERQSEEGKDVSAGRALLAATPGAALETAGGLIPFGKFLLPSVLGKEAGRQVQKLLSRGQIKAAENLANETVAKSVAKGIPLGAGVEGATEAAQAMLSRWQAGLPLFNDEAFQEYGENAYGGALVGGTIGGASRPLGRGAAAKEAEAIRTEEETRDRIEAQRKVDATRAQFEGERKPLALPAPAERAIPAKVPMELENASLADESLVKFKLTELTPDVRKYVEESRANKGLPKLKSYTIEDIQDSMPGIDPKGERAALNSILASKTGFDRFVSEGIKPTSALVLKEAENKNIDTQSQGFNDFLKRTTGQSELGGMTPVELYTAYNSLQKMPRMAGEGTQSLPTGSAASRFTEKQYDTALSFIRMTLRDLKTDRLNVGEVVREIKDATGLETDKDAETLLNTALRNGELEQKERKVYRVLNKDTGELSLPIDKEAVAIRRANQMKNGTVQTEQFYEVGMPDIVTARKDMPEGYEMYLEDVADKDVPEGYEIVQEGKTRPLATQTTEEAAQKQIDRIQKRNERRTKNLNKKIEGQQGRIAKAQAAVDDLAARGMGDTSQAKVAQTKLEAETRDANAQIDNFQKEIDEISQPISLRPTRKKVKTTRSRIILRKGDKDIGFFPNKEAATQAMFANMSNAELDAFEDQMNQQEAAGRPRPATAAKAARERASRRKPGIEVRTAEKAAPAETPQQRDERLKRATERFAALGIDSRDRQDVLRGLRDKLKPIMDKLGLGQVGLNVVSGLENGAGGKYDAAKRTISIALDEENPVQTLRHEVIHALKNLGFFTKSQWAALERKARSEWIDKYLKNTMVSIDGNVMTRYNAYKNVLKLSDTDIMEEAIADAFGDFDTNKAPPGMMAAILKRLKAFFEALGNALRGSGFQSAEQIFTKAELGELASGKPEDSLKTKASLRNTTKGLLNPKIEPKYEKIIYDVVEEMGLTPEEFASTSLIHQTGKPGVDQFESDKIGGLADVVQFLQDKRRNSGLPLLNIDNPADRKIIAKLMATEAMAAIRSGGANLEWYDSVINKTLSIAALKYPELDSDLNARMVFRIATAITSQGLNVEDNLKFAMKVYDQFRINGRFPEIGQGEDQGAMINNFKLANYLLDDMGANLMRQFLETEFTAQELRSAGLDIAGELGDEKVLGSAVFGPKIGFGFYSNLNGNFEPVTMDMWFMRTIGRLTGNLKAFRQDLYNSQLTKFRAALDEKGENGIFANQFDKDEIARAKTDDSAAEALVRKVKSAHERDFKNNRQAYDDGTREKSKLVAASETLIKSLDKPKDAPANGSERRNLRDIVRQMVDIVEEKYGKRVPPASLQAVIWYPEQELYKSMGVKLRVTSQNYAGAIEKLLKGEGYGESSISAASKRGSRIAQQLAKSAVAKGAKEAGGEPIRIGPLQTEEKEAFIERGRKRVVLGAEREAPRRKRVIFEVAPDPNNQELTNTWRGLPNDARIAISENIANKIIKRSLDRFGVKGYIDTQVGSYLDDTNPSFALYLDSGDSVSIAKFLGYVLSQDSMMVVSPKAGAGLEKTGAVRINVGDVSPKEIDSIYQRLREIKVDGEQPVGGQSYMNGHMVVLNYSDVPTNQLASLINRKLDNDYEVIVEDVYTSFPEKKDYDYADPSSDPKGNAGVLRQASRDFRSEATRLLQEELESIRPKISAKTGKLKPGEKLSLRTYFESANEAENAVEAAGIPDTKEFKLFYGNSKLRTDDGEPLPMYHGASAVIDVFRDDKPIFVSPTARFAEDFAVVRSDETGLTPKIYPVWVRTETTFDYGNPEHRADVIAEVISNRRKPDEPVRERPVYLERSKQWKSIEDIDEDLSNGMWSTIEDPAIQRSIRKLGYDGFIVREAGQDNLAVFSPNQLKSITGNEGQFSLGDPDIRYSLGKKMTGMPQIDKSIDDAVNKKIASRSAATMGEKVTQAMTPKTVSVIRQQLLNRYQGISDVVKRLQQKRAAETGMDVPMIGEENAENLALLSDLGSGVVASAFGIKGRPGGHVVYRNGAITVDNTKKGLGEIFAPLAQYKDPNVFRYYQYWAGAKRGVRLMGEGREKLFDQSDVARAKELEAKFPEFVQVQKDFIEFNNSLVDTMVKSGVISKEQGNAWVQHADYVPFYRQMENGETTIGPNVFQSMSTVKQPKKLKGGEGQLGDFFESVVRNTKAAVESSLKNNAARAALKAAVELGEAVKLTGTDANLTGPNIVRYFENGQRVAYEAKDSLFVASMSSLHMADIPFLGIISKPADLLRNLVTKDPGFMMANLLRDSMSAWVTSGEKMTPIAGSVASFAKALANKNPTVQALLNAGVIGGYEFSGNVMDSGRQFERDLERKAGKGSKALRVASSVWDALEKGTTASDAATRALVYDRVLAETGNEVEALAKSLEVMNFNRKGANAAVRILTAAVPFLNARMQGLDLFYRVGISPSLSKPLTGAAATAAQRARQKTFFIRGGTIMALSAMYYVAVAGTDEYEDQEQETRDNNWIIGGARIPIPFEVGVLFKVVPERIMALTFGSDTGQDFQKSMQRAIVSTFAFNPIPQTFKPMVEVAANYSFFTGRPIIGQGMQDVDPRFQVSPGTTRGAEALGKALGVSPIKIDHLYKGYTGTMGMYLADVVDSVLDLFGDSPKPSRRFEQLPVIKRFIADPEARGKVTQFYELKRAVDVFVRTSNMLEKSMKPDDWEKYVTENMAMFGVASYVRSIEKQLAESRQMAQMVRNMSASPDEKRDLLTEIGRYEKSLVQNIQEVKKLANQ